MLSMNSELFFNFSAIPQLVIDPIEDSIISSNQEACRLLQLDTLQLQKARASQLFRRSFPAFIVFTQALIERGRSWSDNLLISTHDEHYRVEISGRCSTAGESLYIHLSLQPADELEQLRERSDVERHYRSGIGHWNRVSRVFQEFERENQLLLDAAGEGIYGVDANGITTFVNPAAQRILGYTAEELAWRNMHSMVHHSHADGSHFGIERLPYLWCFS